MDPSLCVSRQILHIDLDGFYAQVEQKRVGLDESVPLAVLQWQGIIAINYAAKGRGVSRFMKIPEAKAVCPDLVFVHVRTIGGGPAAGLAETAPTSGMPGHDGEVRGNVTLSSASPQAIADSVADVPGNAAAAVGEAMALAAAGEGGKASLGSTGLRCVAKACLQRYRVASSEIFHVLERNLSHNAVMEKGGLDEVYLDVTSMVDAELRSLGEGHNGQASEALVDLAQKAVQCSVLEGGVQVDLEHEGDRRLVVAAMIAKRLRDAVRNDPACGYTCSAGVAANKLLAKIGSARNKPAQQTLVLPRAVNGLMQGISLGKIKGLGGKLGIALQELCGTEGKAGDVQQAPWEVLLRAAGTVERAQWVFNIVRGIDDEAVKPKGLIKSLNSCKSFGATSNRNEITKWLGVLSDELAERCVEDEWEHRRRPKSLVLHYRKVRNPERSIRCTMPLPPQGAGRGEAALAQVIFGAATTLFKRCSDPLPCTRLALAATDFHTAPVEGASAITSFFAPAQASNAHRALPQSPHHPHSSPHVASTSKAPPMHPQNAKNTAHPRTPPANLQQQQQQQQQQQHQVVQHHQGAQQQQQQQQQQSEKLPVWGGVLLPPSDKGSRTEGTPQQQQQQQGQLHVNARKQHLDFLLTPSKRLRLEQQHHQQQSLMGECSVSQASNTCDKDNGQPLQQQHQHQHQPQQQLRQPPNVRECLRSILGDPRKPSAPRSPNSTIDNSPAAAAAAAAGASDAEEQTAQLTWPGASGRLPSTASPAASASQDFIEEVEGREADPTQGGTGHLDPAINGGRHLDQAINGGKHLDQAIDGGRQIRHSAVPCHLRGNAELTQGGTRHTDDNISPELTPVLKDEARPSHLLATGLWSPGELKREQQQEQEKREEQLQLQEQQEQQQQQQQQQEQQQLEQQDQEADRGQQQEQGREPTDEERLLASVSIREQQQIMRDLELQRLQRSGGLHRGGGSQASGSARGKGAGKKGGGSNARGRGGKGRGGGGDKKQTSLLNLFQKQA